MKGALMKLGQMASYLDDGLPEPLREALAQLQQDAPPMSAQLSAEAVERELGQPPDAVFAEWDPTPIAAASIGQVHRAITRGGVAVAVKVQYPGVDEAIRSDLDNAGLLLSAMPTMFPGLEVGPLVGELRARLTEELDYRIEAENQQLVADYYAGHPFITVPRVLPELSSSRVLTTELATGARFEEMTSWSAAERNLAAEAIYRFVFRSMYRLHAFNGDPHPGNYLFEPGGRVTFLDFGLVKRFSATEIDQFAQLVQEIAVRHDIKAFRHSAVEMGFLKETKAFSDQEIEDYFRHFYELVMEPGETTVTHEYASEMVRRYFDTTGPHGHVLKAANLPPTFVIIQRINLGLMAVLARLEARADWRRIAEELWPFVDGPPSTALGREEATWRSQVGR
jgi:predicted unusual protein kinase regulating ubiquinone biosynthesis (AarF/ABC1/UbiB family)